MVSLNTNIDKCKSTVDELRSMIRNEESDLEDLKEKKKLEQAELKDCQEQYEKFRLLIEQKMYARKRRENTSTTLDMINSSTSSAKYQRREESRILLEYILEYILEFILNYRREESFLKISLINFPTFKQKVKYGIRKSVLPKYFNYVTAKIYHAL